MTTRTITPHDLAGVVGGATAPRRELLTTPDDGGFPVCDSVCRGSDWPRYPTSPRGDATQSTVTRRR